MTKRSERLPKDRLWTAVIAVVAMLIGVIWMTPMYEQHLIRARQLQDRGIPSALQNTIVIVELIAIAILSCIICQCIKYIIICIDERRIANNQVRRCRRKILEEALNARILREALFEEIKVNGLPFFEEDGLWETLNQISSKSLAEALEDRKRIIAKQAMGGN